MIYGYQSMPCGPHYGLTSSKLDTDVALLCRVTRGEPTPHCTNAVRALQKIVFDFMLEVTVGFFNAFLFGQINGLIYHGQIPLLLKVSKCQDSKRSWRPCCTLIITEIDDIRLR